MSGDYDVGYGKPPTEHRFQKGNNLGNRKGRAKGSRNLKTDLLEELAETVTLSVGGRPERMSKQRAMLKSVVVKAIKGDSHAADRLFNLILRLVSQEDEPATPTLSPEDQAIFDAAFITGGGDDGNQ